MIRSRISKAESIVGLVALLALTTVATPNIFSALASARKARTINNAKMIGIALLEFDSKYGGLPCEDSKEMLIDEGEKFSKGTSANHYFSQLIVSKILDTERIFHVEKMARTKKADDVFNTPETVLSQGENGFAYILKNQKDGFSMADNARILVAAAPLSKGGKLPTFQPKLFHGEGVALHLDCSVGTYKIDEKGHLISKTTGKNVFLTGEETIWGNAAPNIREPWLLDEKKEEAK